MTTATRSSTSRFQSFPTMAHPRDEKSPPTIGSGFGGSWQSTIWANTSFPKREVLGSRGSDDVNPNSLSGSGALAVGSEAEGWGSSPWGGADNTGQSRTNSGSNSPNRTRDNGSIYALENPAAAIGQGRSRPKSYVGVEDDKAGLYPSGLNKNSFEFRTGEKRMSHDPALLGIGAVRPPGSRDSSIPPSRHSDENETGGGFPYFGGHTPSNSLSQRPSLSGHSSFPTTANNRAFHDNGRGEFEAQRQFKSLTLDETSSGMPNGALQTSSTFPNPGTQPFIPNPGTQGWPSEFGMNGGRYANSYYDSPTRQVLQKRMSGDQVSSSPSGYPVASPESLTSNKDLWTGARPSSRDPGMMAEGERRGHGGQPFIAQPAQAFYPSYYNPNFPPQYHAHLYDLYGGAPHPNFRPQMAQLSGFGMGMNPYLAGAAALPLRPAKDQDPGKGVRSVLLEEFRSSSKSNKRFELKDIYGHVVEFSGDQHGSRFIQQKLETANSDEKEQVFREIEPDAIQLMKDVFGNYVIQKFFEHGNQVQKKVLASQMKGKVVSLSMQMYACRVVQKALEHVLVEQQAELVKELEPDIMKIVRDQNGNHVVQKIIELVPRHYIDFVMNAFRGQVSALAAHTYGCRVIQRMLEYGTEQDKEDILAELHSSSQNLITDQYGNYVTQHVIQHGKPEDRARIIKLVTKQLLTLSKHKFASNVVEKCIEYGSPDERREIREQLTTVGPDGTSPLQLMMKDQYGNYVIQKLLNQLEGVERESFVDEMRPQFVSLKKVSTGRQITAIDRLMSAAASPAPSKASSVAPTVPSAPPTPALQVDVNSPAPTPVLTMEPNSPRSSSPPSTNASAVGELVDESGKTKTVEGGEDACPEVRVQEN